MRAQRQGVSEVRQILGRWYLHAQRLFHLLVASVFLLLALAGASVSLAEWQHYRQSPSEGLLRFGLLAGFTVFLVILGLYTFAKARSVR